MQVPFHKSKKYWGAASALLFILYWIIMIWIYRYLPDQIPMHFNLAGEATRYSDTSFFSWFFVPLVVTFTGLHTLLIGWAFLMAGIENLNFPEKKRILKLSKDQQKPIKKILKGYLIKTVLITFCYMIVLFIFIGIYSWLYSVNQQPIPLLYPILGLTVLYLVLISLDYFGLKKLFKEKLDQVI